MNEKILVGNGIYLFKNAAKTLDYYSDIKQPKTYIDILNKNGIYNDAQLMIEYDLIQQKQSKLPRVVRDIICKLINK